MSRPITLKHEYKGLSHVYVRTWSEDAGTVCDVYAGSIDRGELKGLCTETYLADDEMPIAMAAYKAAQ